MPRRPRRRGAATIHRSARDAAAGDTFLTTGRLIEATGYTREALWRLRHGGQLVVGVHYVRLGRRLLWHAPNFERWRLAFEGDHATDGNGPGASGNADGDGGNGPGAGGNAAGNGGNAPDAGGNAPGTGAGPCAPADDT